MTLLQIVFIILSVISPITYVYKSIKGSVRPHRVTRLVIWVASLTSLVVTLGSDSPESKMFGIVFFARATLLLLVSLRYGVGGRSKLDIFCLLLGIVGVVVSLMGSGLVGLLLAVIADLIGCIPAFIKTYKEPKTEEPWFFALEATAALLIIYGVGQLRIDIILPIYFVVVNITMLILMYRKKLFQPAQDKS